MSDDSGPAGAGRYRGFSRQLATPQDLLAKLRHDLDRMEKDPASSYAAFDFFVTAEHMGEWCEDDELRHGEHGKHLDLLLVCDIANNGKHFIRERPPKTSLDSIVESDGAFQVDAFQVDAFQIPSIYLLSDEGYESEALPLARRVLDFWHRVVDEQ